MSPAVVQRHHHRSTTKTGHKPFKSRFATKGSLKAKAKGKTDDTSSRKTPHQQVLSKLERRHKARQIATNKHRDVLRAGKIFDGRRGAPRIIAVVPLCADCDGAEVARRLNGSLDISAEIPSTGVVTVGIDRFKQKIQYVIPPRHGYFAVLDACKLADFVVFILSAKEQVDSYGESLLRAIEGQGLSNTVTVVQHLDTVEPAKRRADVKKSLLSFIKHFFPTELKVHSLDAPQDAQNVIRSLCTQNPKGIRWRDARSYLLAEQVRWDEKDGLVVAGTVRGKGMKADRLLHIQGYGDFQIEKICSWSQDEHPPASSDAMAMDTDAASNSPQVLEFPTEAQDDLAELAPEESVMRDADADDTQSIATTNPSGQPKGVLIDDHYYFDEEEDERYKAPRRLPKGTSAYQAAWILDSDFEESDLEDVEDEEGDVEMKVEDDGEEDEARPEDGEEGMVGDSKSTYAATEFGDDAKSEMFLDPSPEQEAAQIDAFRNRQKDAAEDLEFPDEIELPPNALARERLARYRGLKSLRSSKWETSPDVPYQPENWNRLAQIQNYTATKNKVLNEALVGGVPAGTRVLLYIRNGLQEIAAEAQQHIISVFSLLRHEHKKAMVHFSIMPTISGNIDDDDENLNSLVSNPIKSKDPLILQCGPRRLLINPLFSQASSGGSNDVYRFERFLHPARASVATVIAPLTFGNVPVLFFRLPPAKSTNNSATTALTLLATGTSLPPTPRIIAKRIVLTGHPYRIHKRLVTVRYMFFNREDVNYFRAVQLYTKRGRCGYIKESLGTHGYFKATFDGRIGAMDAVAMSLYKRVFPREASEWRG
ncbi:putative ribosome biogenesis protein tsr1 like protein [Kalaharituber pfeilii]|nr:putative ribosome biogenesis protein tsr1 like protein [Kalaharituber pfeilii]